MENDNSIRDCIIMNREKAHFVVKLALNKNKKREGNKRISDYVISLYEHIINFFGTYVLYKYVSLNKNICFFSVNVLCNHSLFDIGKLISFKKTNSKPIPSE